jgi:acetyl esterase/lipase
VAYGSAIDFDGERQRLALDLYTPGRRGRPRPAVIWVHGGGFTFGDRLHMTPYARSFAERGYVSATITYRLADDGELARVGFGPAIRAAQHDAQAAVRWLRRHARRLGVDPSRIYIGGHSAGAVTALEVGVSRHDPGRSGNPGYSSRVDGAIAMAGLILDKSQLDRRDAPILLFHGDADRVVPFAGSTSICRAARPVGLGCRLVAFPGADHLVAYSKLDEIVSRSARWMRRQWEAA